MGNILRLFFCVYLASINLVGFAQQLGPTLNPPAENSTSFSSTKPAGILFQNEIREPESLCLPLPRRVGFPEVQELIALNPSVSKHFDLSAYTVFSVDSRLSSVAQNAFYYAQLHSFSVLHEGQRYLFIPASISSRFDEGPHSLGGVSPRVCFGVAQRAKDDSGWPLNYYDPSTFEASAVWVDASMADKIRKSADCFFGPVSILP